MVAVVQDVKRDAKTQRVNLPAPFAGRQIGIFDRREHVARRLVHAVRIGGADSRHIVREADEVHGAFFEYLLIPRLFRQGHAFPFEGL